VNEASTLLRTIAAVPDDDAPRLAWAGWLEQHGDAARAEFIRAQCELADSNLKEQRQGPLKRREKELLHLHKAAWTAALRPLGARAEVTFRRGLVEEISISGKADDAGFACVQDQPLLRSLVVMDCPITDDGLQAVRCLTNLRELHLVRCRISDAGLAALESLTNLEALSLSGCEVSDDGLKHLEGLPRLFRVEADNTAITEQGLEALRLAQARAFPGLSGQQKRDVALAFLRRRAGVDTDPDTGKVLGVSFSDYPDLCDDELVYLSAFPYLQEIRLENNWITGAGLKHLAQLQDLRALHLTETGVTSIQALAGLTQLRVLHLRSQHQLRDEGMQGLENLKNLEELYLAGAQITDATLQRLAGLSRLRVLDLSFLGDRISNEGLAALRGLTELQELRLNDNENITDKGVAHLAGLTRLVNLSLRSTGISDSGLAHLHGMQELDLLLLDGSQVTVVGAERLVESLPVVAVGVAGQLIRKRRRPVCYHRRALDEHCSIEVGDHWEVVSWRGSPEVWVELREEGFQQLEDDYLNHGAATVEIHREEVEAGTTARQVVRERFHDRDADGEPPDEDARPAVCSRRFTEYGRTHLAFAWVRKGLAYTLVGWVPTHRQDEWAAVLARMAHSVRFLANRAGAESESSTLVADERPGNAPATPAEPAAEEAALLQAVQDRPEDDAPRLRYGARLEQRGDAYGEFIRLQCPPRSATDEELDAAQERTRLLLVRHGWKWLTPLERLGLRNPHFHRGFVEQGEMAAAALVDHAEPLFRLAPLLRQLALQWAWIDLDRLAACPGLARIQSLGLSNRGQGSKLGPQQLARLLASPYLGGLRALDLSFNPLGPAGVKVVADSPALAGLTSLTLTSCALDDAAVQHLAASPHLAELQTLSLSGGVTAEGIRALAGSAYLTHLTSLDLEGCQLDDEGTQVLASSPRMAGLTSLALSNTGLADEGVKALASSPWITRLRTLVLSQNLFGDAGLTALAASPNLTNLTSLQLRDLRTSADALGTLLSSPHLKNLTSLALDASRLGPVVLYVLLDCPLLDYLSDLDLSALELDDSHIHALAASPRVRNLHKLDLSGAAVGNAGVEALVSSPHLGRLRWLRLGSTSGVKPSLRDQLWRRFREN
jgi:uncharacterized protein (TIGR02996 family)